MKHVRLSIASGVFILAMMAARAQIVPVAISSGFTDDAVLENGTAGTKGDLADGLEGTSDVLVAHDYAVAHPELFDDPKGVLPQNGTITNSVNGAVFQFQPYDALNVAVVTDNLTLTLAQPAAYSELSFLLINRSSGRGVGTWSFTLNYAGGVKVYSPDLDPVPYWEGVADPSGGEIATSLTTVLEGGSIPIGPVQFDEYDFNVDPSNGPLESITFYGGNNNKLDVFAVSGIDPVEAPEPEGWAMLLAAAGALVFARRRADRAV